MFLALLAQEIVEVDFRYGMYNDKVDGLLLVLCLMGQARVAYNQLYFIR
jgi:hypothetical protein